LIDEHRLTREVQFRDGAEVVERQILSLEEGLGFRVGVDTYTAELLPRFDGRRTLDDILVAATNRMQGEIDRSEYNAGALRVVKRLVEAGIVSPT
jgi:hypothetical protein